jgi:hypothetical protein
MAETGSDVLNKVFVRWDKRRHKWMNSKGEINRFNCVIKETIVLARCKCPAIGREKSRHNLQMILEGAESLLSPTL